MSQPLPQIYPARHGETAWWLSGQHTGKTDPGLWHPAHRHPPSGRCRPGRRL